MAAEAPVGLRMAATTASVSGTSRRAEPHRGILAFVEKAHDRHPPRPSGFPKMSWIYGGRHGFPGAWDWRQLGDLQSLQCRGIADIGRAATGSIGRPVHGGCRRGARQVLLRRFRADSRAAAVVREPVRMDGLSPRYLRSRRGGVSPPP